MSMRNEPTRDGVAAPAGSPSSAAASNIATSTDSPTGAATLNGSPTHITAPNAGPAHTTAPAATTAEPIIQLTDVHAAYPGAQTEALAGITLSVMPGEYACVLGGNGSGKSTLIQVMNALVAPIAGSARIAGLDPADPAQALEIRRCTGSVFQHPEDQMVTSIVADDVAFGPENLCAPQPEIARRVHDALADVDMLEHALADPSDLSGGQKQRVAIAGALAMRPRILLLDEPAAMLDTGGRRDIQRIIARLHEQGITIVHVTHFMDDALQADRVLVLDGGNIALEGTPREVFAHRDRLRALGLDVPFYLQLQERLEELEHPCAPCTTEEELLDELARALLAPIAAAVIGRKAKHPADPAQRNATTAPNDLPGDNATNHPAATPAIAFERACFSYAAPRSAGGKRSHANPLARLLLKPRTNSSDLQATTIPWALRELTVHIEPGELTAIIGKTGSGKSTAAELACALKLPTCGSASIDGIDTANRARRRELRRHVGYVSQLPERQLFAETVYDDIAFGPRNLGLDTDEVTRRVLDAAQMLGLPTDPDFMRRSPFALSGGQQRGVALAGVLAMRQPVLVLDEPMAGLDPAGRERVRALLKQLKQQGITILLVTHDMDDVAELADRVIALDTGCAVAIGTPAEVFATALENRRNQVAAPLATGEVAQPSVNATDSATTPGIVGQALTTLGVPSATAFAARLAERIGVHTASPAETDEADDLNGWRPLTLDALAHDIALALEEVAPHGTAR